MGSSGETGDWGERCWWWNASVDTSSRSIEGHRGSTLLKLRVFGSCSDQRSWPMPPLSLRVRWNIVRSSRGDWHPMRPSHTLHLQHSMQFHTRTLLSTFPTSRGIALVASLIWLRFTAVTTSPPIPRVIRAHVFLMN